MTEPNWLDYVAAGATAASAAVIAWQAWLTRSAVRASQDTVKVAAEALRESQLSRLESGVPRITVSTRSWIDTDEAQVSAPTQDQPHAFRAISPDEVFKLPRDADKMIRAHHELVVRNDGPGTVTVTVPIAFRPLNGSNVIPPGAETRFAFAINKSVQQWVGLLEGEAGLAYKAPIVYQGPRDADVTETHTLVVAGSVLSPVSDALGDWEIDPFNSTLEARILPATRIYWRSRSREEQF